MSPRNRQSKEILSTDKLTSDKLPPSLEVAQAEYFADMAFDDRLLDQLQLVSPSTSIDITHVTTSIDDELTKQYFAPNTTVEASHEIILSDDESELITAAVEAHAYRLSGTVERQSDMFVINANIASEIGDFPTVRIQTDTSVPDCFYLSKDGEEFDVSILDTKEVFSVICQLTGAKKWEVDQVMLTLEQTERASTPSLEVMTEELWGQLGESFGKRKIVREIHHEVENPRDVAFPETIRLRYEELENPDVTLVKLFLVHSTEMPSFDAKESYTLSLIFEQINHRNTEKVAEKIIESSIGTPKLISSSFEQQVDGRITQLDINDVAVKQLYIDWFDQVVTA